jgi:hypothetical protein
MSIRVYMTLDILEKKSANTIQNLRSTEGVVAIDPLEGHPNYLLIVEAPDRQKLVESLVPVLSSLERVTKDLHSLLIRENNQTSSFFNAGNLDPISILRPSSVAPMMPATSLVS